VIGLEDFSDNAFMWCREITSTKSRLFFSIVWIVYAAICSPGPTQYIFHTSMARYSLFVLKVTVNINQTKHFNEQALRGALAVVRWTHKQTQTRWITIHMRAQC